MSFTGNEDHTIDAGDAATMNRRFREEYTDQPQGIYFSQTTLNNVLGQTDCVGIRFYFALDADYKLKLTFCGVLENEDDILEIVGDGGSLCPPHCGTSNELNSDI
jgi:hypothetical protein